MFIIFSISIDPNQLKVIQINSKTGDINFNHNVAINGKSIIKQGDNGVSGLGIRDTGDVIYSKECGFFYLPHGAIGSLLPTSALTGINIVNHPDWGVKQCDMHLLIDIRD